ncbi:MAG: ferredoxin reductase [Panacagrimonas sp.]
MSRLPLQTWLAPFVSPAVFDFWAARLNPAASWDRSLARVVSRRVEARDAVTLVLEPNRHFDGFRAGQHVNVSVEVDGVRHTRSYSPSDVPRADGRVSITVRRVPGGKVSEQLCLHTRVGGVLELGPAFGEMTGFDGPRLYCAAGSGVTPLMSLVRAAVQSKAALDLDLVYWASRRAELCFADELRGLAQRIPGLRIHFVLTREAELQAGESAGRPSAELIDRLVPDHAQRVVHACGPAGFVESLREMLATDGAGFHAECFTPPAPLAPVDVTGTVRVQLTRSGRTLELTAGTPLLAALEAQGLKPAYGCRMGLCNTCACGKQQGTTQHLVSGDIDPQPRSALRICVNRAVSDLILDL